MNKPYASLTSIEGLQKITKAQYPDFLYQLQLGLLLALKEGEWMNEMACRYAQQKLARQYRKPEGEWK